MDELQELKTLLKNVPDSYSFFADGLYNDTRDDKRLIKPISDFIKNNPHANSSDVLEYCLDLYDELGIEDEE